MRSRSARSGAWPAIGALLLTIVPFVAPANARSSGLASPLCLARQQPPAVGLHVSSTEAPDPARHPRLQQWSLVSQAMSGATVKVNVLVPPGYSPNGKTRYRTLYLLHGHGGGADDWWRKADAHGTSLERILGRLPVLVVMPDGGYDGWYSDWYGVDVDGHGGTNPDRAPAWETFHVRELVGFIDRHYRTRTDRGGRLIAGQSMGGYGAMTYATRHPDLFSTAASFSGALDVRLYDPAEPLVQPAFQNVPDRKLPDNCVWGDGITQHAVWVAHNPTDQAAHLEQPGRTVAAYLSSGDGCLPSPANPDPRALPACAAGGRIGPSTLGGVANEWGVRQQSQAFRSALESYCRSAPCGPRQYDFYRAGVHDWPFWLAELGKFLGWAHQLGRV